MKLLTILLATLASVTLNTSASKKQTFSVEGRDFQIDGKKITLLSGEMHYPRTPKAYWRDRLKKARAMGLNTICTYVFWNRHEPNPGEWNFEGDDNLIAFIKTCQEEGLYVIVRPGPYVCTEWDCGGIPGWVMADPKTRIRTNDPKFMKPAMAYLEKISGMLAPYQIENGGPILMLQVENEYGSFDKDKVYLKAHKDAIRKGGYTGTLFTADGPNDHMLTNGTLPGITATVNFGGGSQWAFKQLDKHRPGQARMVGEFWVGWFDHWTKPHHSTAAAPKNQQLDWMLQNDVSVNFYMFHGGTNFGFYAGANWNGGYFADTTSYDYSAVLDEAGRPTDKYHAFRATIKKHVPEATFGPLPEPTLFISIPEIKLTGQTHAFDHLPAPVIKPQPVTMEALQQSLGFILYETTIQGGGLLKVDALQDRAQVYLNDKPIGILDRASRRTSLPVTAGKGEHTLRILVENMGRINFSRAMLDERKGLHGKVTLNGKTLSNWNHYRLPVDKLDHLTFSNTKSPLPVWKRGSFSVKETGDTYLDMSSWGKGVVWVNGHNLGRYWEAGPQQALYLPGCWLHKDKENTITILELEKPDTPDTLSGVTDQIWQVKADPSLLNRKPGQNLDLTGSTPIHTGQFKNNGDWQKLTLKQNPSGRYFTLEALDAHDGKNFATITELEFYDENGKMIPREEIRILYADSEEITAEAGSASNVIDNQPTSYWHTQWKGKSPGFPHQIVLDLGKKRTINGIRYQPRIEKPNGRIKSYRLYLSDTKPNGI